jgi:FkbM family methyltransferase
MVEAPPFEFDRCDTYMYFASNMLPDDPVIVEVGSIHGAHGIKLCKKFNNELTMIAYEAGQENNASLVAGIAKAGAPIVAHRAVVTGSDGTAEFYEFVEESSNSIYPRHQGEGRRLRRTSNIRSVSLNTIIEENDCSRIDLLFLNCEGAEIGILKEVLRRPELRDRLGQLCVSFHGGRIYPQQETEEMVRRMSEFFWVVEEQNDWPCHLFVNKGLESGRE